jgi:hypothetical protein
MYLDIRAVSKKLGEWYQKTNTTEDNKQINFILKANKVNLFVSSVVFVFWHHSPNILDTPPNIAP